MNIVIIYGKIVSKIEFKFIYDRYYINNKENYMEEKYKHISIAKSMVKLQNESTVEVYGYDNMADYMYRNLKEDYNVLIKGKIDSNMKV